VGSTGDGRSDTDIDTLSKGEDNDTLSERDRGDKNGIVCISSKDVGVGTQPLTLEATQPN